MSLRKTMSSACKWLYPGMGVKRWLGLLVVGLFVLNVGASFFYVEAYRSLEFTGAASPIAYSVTLQFLPHWVRGLLLVSFGLGTVGLAIFRLNQSLISCFLVPDNGSIVDIVYNHRRRQRGPEIVALGGGHGLSTLLRGLKERTDHLTAIVTVADDGGSSGRLREELGLLPPGDIRNCIAALADAEPLMTQLFQYRFGEGVSLNGHSFGNLFIVAMAGITGDFARAIRLSSKVLAVRGRVLPATMRTVTLWAELAGESGDVPHQVRGESRIPDAGAPVERVFLEPSDVPAFGEAVRAILEADMIVVGPGSLYTSILPNLLVKDIAAALSASSALKVYVCNVATQAGETDGFSVADHLRALHKHVAEGLFDVVLVNNNLDVPRPPGWRQEMVQPTTDGSYRVWATDLVDEAVPWRHDPKKLASAVMDIYATRGVRHPVVG